MISSISMPRIACSPKLLLTIRALFAVCLLLVGATQVVAQIGAQTPGDKTANTDSGSSRGGQRRTRPQPSTGSLIDYGSLTSVPDDAANSTENADTNRVPTASASQIIEVLQANPEVTADLKDGIATRMRAQGKPVTADLITDDALFEQIRTNPTAKDYAASELMKRGLLSSGVTAQSDTTRDASSGGAVRKADTEMEQSEPKFRKRPSPYSSVPALRELYSQVPADSDRLQRFGINIFLAGQAQDKLPMDLPAGPDYMVGPGDSLDITLSGGISQTLKRVVDREGTVSLLEAGLILVSGHSLNEVQHLMETALRGQYRNLKVQVSVSRLRTIRVYVVGDVTNPGPYDISSLSTPLNALLAAGGPNSRGSMRRIRHLRNDKVIGEFDTYDLLLHGVKGKVESLQSGDTILVPPVVAQVYLDGMVRRPAIYELRSEKNIAEALDLAGGVLSSGTLRRIRVQRVIAHEGRRTLTLDTPEAAGVDAVAKALTDFIVQDGDRITVYPIAGYSDQTVYLQGHVVRPGKQPYSKGMTVSDVLSSYHDLLPEPAARGEIVRLMPPDLHPETIFFNVPDAIAPQGSSITLEPFDTIRIYGRYETDAPKVTIYGEVIRPGNYPLSDGMKATDLLRMAGGFKRSAFTEVADLTSYELQNGEKIVTDNRTIRLASALGGEADIDARLKPGDVLSIRQLTGWNDIGAAITIKGEIFHPGTYGIHEGERLSSVLRRAGLFRSTAYVPGAELERVQVKEIDRKSRELLIRRIEASQPTVAATTSAADQTVFAQAFLLQRQQTLARLRSQEPTGRMVIRISNDVTKWENTSADIEVRAGDQLVIPKRPGFVLLDGQVNNPAAITFSPGKNASWYLTKAGGPTESGNKKKIFVIRADGSVIGREGSGFWSGGVLSTVMQPGDAVIVPEKIIGPPIWRSLLDVAQLVSSFAITASVLKR